MRPQRFERLLLDAATSIPGVTAQTLAAAGHTAHPYGIAVQAAGRTTRWQIVAAHQGDDYARPEPAPTLGERLPEPPLAAVTTDPATVEQALVAAVLRGDQGEIRAVAPYSQRPDPPAVAYGATFDLYSGARIYLNAIS
ncbi:hypothetical protein CFP65_7330 [Kitasatospora sp. MMS16-BH015]|uniref:hypothetical protein n=1 Tax=Kitasatospora sp. MMS16-BH015 TaxID=2018025 RepID=UPI000CA13B7B|nr:hypothetical protein [Kitasatospora sp. MMS16-BH015]AUG81916.1 hypothetical protein CFP65_7330 [Kitasatospora sp. MMS16-BH015]